MTKNGRNIVAALMLGVLLAGVSGCKKNDGPMEQTGRGIDKAVEKTGQQINKAIDKTGDKVEQAGEKMKESVK